MEQIVDRAVRTLERTDVTAGAGPGVLDGVVAVFDFVNVAVAFRAVTALVLQFGVVIGLGKTFDLQRAEELGVGFGSVGIRLSADSLVVVARFHRERGLIATDGNDDFAVLLVGHYRKVIGKLHHCRSVGILDQLFRRIRRLRRPAVVENQHEQQDDKPDTDQKAEYVAHSAVLPLLFKNIIA